MLTTSAYYAVDDLGYNTATAVVNAGLKSALTSLDSIDCVDGKDALSIPAMVGVAAPFIDVIIKNVGVTNVRLAGNFDMELTT